MWCTHACFMRNNIELFKLLIIIAQCKAYRGAHSNYKYHFRSMKANNFEQIDLPTILSSRSDCVAFYMFFFFFLNLIEFL